MRTVTRGLTDRQHLGAIFAVRLFQFNTSLKDTTECQVNVLYFYLLHKISSNFKWCTIRETKRKEYQ